MTTLARRLWEAIEPIHAIAYFDPGPTDALKALGLRGWWMSYFAGRFAPLGPITAEPAAAMAFGFAPRMVARALPTAWRSSHPNDVLSARIAACASALDRIFPNVQSTAFDELEALLRQAASACACEGRPLAAGWQSVDAPDNVLGALWLHATVLRENRGDGHVIAAVALGLPGLEATITHVATGAISRELMQPNRGWTDAEWDETVRRVQARGLIDRDGRLTKAGGSLRRELEATTDRLAAGPVERLGPSGVERLIDLALPLSRHLVDGGVVPVPNPIGVPRP